MIPHLSNWMMIVVFTKMNESGVGMENSILDTLSTHPMRVGQYQKNAWAKKYTIRIILNLETRFYHLENKEREH